MPTDFSHNISKIIRSCTQSYVRNTTSPYNLLLQQLGVARERIPVVSLILDKPCHKRQEDGNCRPGTIRWAKTSLILKPVPFLQQLAIFYSISHAVPPTGCKACYGRPRHFECSHAGWSVSTEKAQGFNQSARTCKLAGPR